MNHQTVRMLLVEDDQVDAMAITRFITREKLPYQYSVATSTSEAREILSQGTFDIVVADYILGDGTCLDLFEVLKDTPMIVVTGSGDEATAVTAMKKGARDYLIKDPQGNYLAVLPPTVKHVLERCEAEAELKHYREHLEMLVQQRTSELSSTNLALKAEISERKHAEQKLTNALQEKTALLHEVHHRVNNNLQVMISLMQMSRRQVVDPQARQLFLRIQTQARAMSLVYELLGQAESLAHVHMPTYLRRLIDYLQQVLNGTEAVDISLDVDELSLDVENATPCGLIVNELVTNALKHAFSPTTPQKPSVTVTLKHKDGQYILKVADNGKGMPEGFSLETTSLMGLHLVYLWATHQMDGSCSVSSNHGTTYTITFKGTAETTFS